MKAIKNILFTTDYSDCANHAFSYAVDLAKCYDAKIHILHANVLPAAAGYLSITFNNEEALDFLKKSVSELNMDPSLVNRVRHHVSSGLDAANLIVEFVKENAIDLVVMGTHGRSGLKHALMGSVTEKVIRKAKMPVFVVHESDAPKKLSEMKHILVPIDFSTSSATALIEAAHVAKMFNMHLTLIHVVPEFIEVHNMAKYIDVLDSYPSVLEEAFERLKDFEKQHTSFKNVTYHVTKGKVLTEVLDYCKENSSDLIVMAKRSYTFTEHLFLGKTTERLLQNTHMPLLILGS